ncbi:MAG TPA: MHYT domain-containing protein [Candidatus Eremiobacteraceae bacterium]|nr:MHYT domain-containing protein [Candidatus Eremiobacteraceae bacterium]
MNPVNGTLPGSYDYRLVALSVLIAILASYTALDLAGRVKAARGWARLTWLTGGAIAMGLGIWSMHYIGMLAFSLPVPVRYFLPTVVMSLLAAIFASAVALYVASRQKMGPLPAAIGSIIMGSGIAGMHYIGMAAMRLSAECMYDIRLVSLSVVLAIVISLVALWLTFRFREEMKGTGWRKIASALVMGAAIPVMHYTGMAAASFAPSGVPPDWSHAVSISSLGVAAITIVTFMVLGVAVFTSFLDRRFSAQTLELESSEARYRLLFERSLAGVYRITLEGRILDCNDAFSRIFGYASRAEHLAHAADDHYLGPADREAYSARLQEQKAVTNFERCLRRKDGNPVWVLESATFLDGNNGAPGVIEGTLIDITERKQAEAELKKALQMKSDFVSFATHQLRTPLAGIKWSLELAAQEENLSEETASFIEDGRESAQRLIGMVNDLLDISRLESGKLKLAPKETNLAELTQSVLKDVSHCIEKQGHHLSVSGIEGIPAVLVDPELFRQVILNMVSNAIKYTPSGGKIDIRMARENSFVRWAITDCGIGIPKASQARLFEKFYRAENVYKIETEGTGLGLHLVKLIVEKSGGRIWCESEENKGSTFQFTLPLGGGNA